jgi:hypothetical protein
VVAQEGTRKIGLNHYHNNELGRRSSVPVQAGSRDESNTCYSAAPNTTTFGAQHGRKGTPGT